MKRTIGILATACLGGFLLGCAIGEGSAGTSGARQKRTLIVNEPAEHFFVFAADSREAVADRTEGEPNAFSGLWEFRFPSDITVSEAGVRRYVDALAGGNLTHFFIDFIRFPNYFRKGEVAAGAATLTGFVRGLRAVCDEAARRRGHPVKIVARLLPDPEPVRIPPLGRRRVEGRCRRRLLLQLSPPPVSGRGLAGGLVPRMNGALMPLETVCRKGRLDFAE